MLANSFDEVVERISRRGEHSASSLAGISAGRIADAFRMATHGAQPDSDELLGVPKSQLSRIIFSNHLVWAPDGDEAFDDGSFVFHFDVENRVRLIGYRLEPYEDDYRHDSDSLREVWLDADTFYQVLERWRGSFYAEWESSPKKSEC
jgi:hypothetical protein